MKIVIDIPDYDVELIKEYYEGNDIVESTYSYIYHGQPLSEILDKISDQTAGVPYHFWDDEAYISVHDIREIIEQLKGGE